MRIHLLRGVTVIVMQKPKSHETGMLINQTGARVVNSINNYWSHQATTPRLAMKPLP